MMALSKLVLFLVHRGAVLDLCKGFNIAEPRNYLDGHALIRACIEGVNMIFFAKILMKKC